MPKSELTIQIGKDGRSSITDVKSSAEQNGGQQPETSATFKSMSWGAKWRYIKEFVTIEPLLVLYIFGISLPTPASENLKYQKACLVDSGFNDTICNIITSGASAEYNITDVVNEVHLHITDTITWLNPANTVLPLILTLFWGSYSDRHQIRKPFLLLPLFGELLSLIGCILATIFLRQWNLATYLSIATFPSTCLGGQTLLVMAVYAYLADVSTVEQRTLRIGVCQTAMSIALISGSALSGVYFLWVGYYGVFITSFVIQLLGFLYTVFYIKDNLKSTKDQSKCILFDLFDPSLIMESLRVILVKKVGNHRLYMVLFMTILFIYNGLFAGEGTILLLYLNANLGFSPVDCSYLLTFGSIIFLIGVIIGTYLFTKVFKFSDYSIMIVVMILKIIANIELAAALNKPMVYIGICIEMFNNLSTIALRSLATKVVRQEDLGKAQSFFGIFETLGGTAIATMYTGLIYPETQTSFPTAFLYASIFFVIICISIVFFIQMRVRRKLAKTTNGINGNKQGFDNRGMNIVETEISHM